MKEAMERYRSLTVVFGLVVMVVIQSISLGKSGRLLTGPIDADLSQEKRTLKSFAADLSALEKKCFELGKQATITRQEFSTARTSTDGLRGRVSLIQQAVRSVIDKLKAAGQWENFDSTALARVTDARQQSAIREAGGPRRILEDAASQLGGLSQDVDTLLQPLSSKITADAGRSLSDQNIQDLRSRVVRVAIAPSAPMRDGLRCQFRGVLFLLDDSNENSDRYNCACGIRPLHSTSCDDVRNNYR